jgi:hypothetical protein
LLTISSWPPKIDVLEFDVSEADHR